MKNHFIIPYVGNKREEVEEIYKNINLDNIETIVEPYCGSAAISYYISTKHPKKFKYILNDNNNLLIELYKILSNDEKTKEFITKIINMCFDKDKNFINKEKYNIIVKQETVESYFIKHKYYNMRCGLYPQNKKFKVLNYDEIIKTPIINFLKNENIIFSNEDATGCILKNNKKESLILCDPPYLMSCNALYNNPDCNIYEWLFNNLMILKNCIFILENNWIIKLLFRDIPNKIEYDKTYNGIHKKNVKHIIIKLIN